MLDKVKGHIEKVQAFKADSKEAIEAFRIEYLGSKGLLKDLFAKFLMSKRKPLARRSMN
jgi:phenylalanyl-tRNA synthetase alpha chain